jgi:thiamine biosynthesis lipoprotein
MDRTTFDALGSTAVVVVTDDRLLTAANRVVERIVEEVDRACSRFRCDSELTNVNARPGEPVVVSDVLIGALEAALYGARATDGLVDPTVGAALRDIGYDRDFAEIDPDGPPLQAIVRAVPGWQRVRIHRARRTVTVPRGVEIDLGAIGKAWCADRAAAEAAAATGCGVLVGLGGDLAFAGEPPEGGWKVSVAEDHRSPLDAPESQPIAMQGGGLATSGTSVRRWTRGDRAVHHIVDPASGRSASDHWRLVTVAAESCTHANIASTATIVLGRGAPEWLAARGLPARLVAADGTIATVAGWPSP